MLIEKVSTGRIYLKCNANAKDSAIMRKDYELHDNYIATSRNRSVRFDPMTGTAL